MFFVYSYLVPQIIQPPHIANLLRIVFIAVGDRHMAMISTSIIRFKHISFILI